MNMNWTQGVVFGLVALLAVLVAAGCLVLLLAGGGLAGYGFGGAGWCPRCAGGAYGTTYGPGTGGLPRVGGYGPMIGFTGPLFGLLMMGAVIGLPVLVIALLFAGLLAWWQPHPITHKETNQ